MKLLVCAKSITHVCICTAKLCHSCGAKPRQHELFNRHCLSPSIVNCYLNHISTEMSNLTVSSVICMPCYNKLCNIYALLVCQPLVYLPMTLMPLLQCCHKKCNYTDQKGEILVYEMIVYQSAETLAAVMKADEAMLLSRLYQEFLSMIQIESKDYPSLSLTEEKHSQSSLGFV